MDFKEYQERINNLDNLSNNSRREKVINSGLSTITKSGNISGNLKSILYNDDTEIKRENIEKLKDNVADIMYNLTSICNSLDISIEDILLNNINKK
ncbi:MAG: hypothetical protein PHD15_06335 [Clostridia bacterium]|nr:hypothetical protein [Clostridia bacterium]MDD4387348.1 hypothetical protein [Clostridia bacterium]